MREEEPEEDVESVRDDILEMEMGNSVSNSSVTANANSKTSSSLVNEKKFNVVTLKEDDFQMIFGSKLIRKPTALAVEVVNKAVNDNIVRLMSGISEATKKDLANSKYSVFFKKYSQLVLDLALDAGGGNATSTTSPEINLANVSIIPPLKHKPRYGLTFSQRLANLRKPVPKPYTDADIYIWRTNGQIEAISPLSPPPLVNNLVLGECPTAELRESILKNLQTPVRRAPSALPILPLNEYGATLNQVPVRNYPLPASTPLSNHFTPRTAGIVATPPIVGLNNQTPMGALPPQSQQLAVREQPASVPTLIATLPIPNNNAIVAQQIPLSPPPAYGSVVSDQPTALPRRNQSPPVRIPNSVNNAAV